MLKVASPALTLPVPNVVAPSLKVTVPVGLDPVTVAVSAVFWLTKAGLTLLERTVVVVVPCELTV